MSNDNTHQAITEVAPILKTAIDPSDFSANGFALPDAATGSSLRCYQGNGTIANPATSVSAVALLTARAIREVYPVAEVRFYNAARACVGVTPVALEVPVSKFVAIAPFAHCLEGRDITNSENRSGTTAAAVVNNLLDHSAYTIAKVANQTVDVKDVISTQFQETVGASPLVESVGKNFASTDRNSSEFSRPRTDIRTRTTSSAPWSAQYTAGTPIYTGTLPPMTYEGAITVDMGWVNTTNGLPETHILRLSLFDAANVLIASYDNVIGGAGQCKTTKTTFEFSQPGPNLPRAATTYNVTPIAVTTLTTDGFSFLQITEQTDSQDSDLATAGNAVIIWEGLNPLSSIYVVANTTVNGIVAGEDARFITNTSIGNGDFISQQIVRAVRTTGHVVYKRTPSGRSALELMTREFAPEQLAQAWSFHDVGKWAKRTWKKAKDAIHTVGGVASKIEHALDPVLSKIPGGEAFRDGMDAARRFGLIAYTEPPGSVRASSDVQQPFPLLHVGRDGSEKLIGYSSVRASDEPPEEAVGFNKVYDKAGISIYLDKDFRSLSKALVEAIVAEMLYRDQTTIYIWTPENVPFEGSSGDAAVLAAVSGYADPTVALSAVVTGTKFNGVSRPSHDFTRPLGLATKSRGRLPVLTARAH